MGNRATVDLTKGQLTEEQFVAAAAAMAELVQSAGWVMVNQLIAGARLAIVQMIHDPNVHKEYVSGMLRAIDTIPDNVAYIVERGQALAKQKVEARESTKTKPVPFVRPGGSTPAV